jgi:putative copper resistance protein D
VTVVDRLPAAPEAPPQARKRIPTVAVGAGGLALVAVLFVALTVGGGPAGSLVDAGVSVSRLVARIAAIGTVGTLLYAAVLHPPALPLTASARAALRGASAWATVWAAATAVHALFELTRLVGASAALSSLRTFVVDLAAGRAAMTVLVATVLLAVLARRCTSALGAGLLLALSLAALVVPAVLTGHSATAEHHLLAVTNLGLHVVAASVWVGGLLALLVHGREALPAAARRYSAVALGCFVATGFSGLLAAWLVLGGTGAAVSGVLGTGYGWLLLAKTTALVALGLFGRQHRRRTLPRLRSGEARSFRSFAAVEVGVMLATVALAVALSASPPPAGAAPQPAAAAAAPAPLSEAPPVADPMAGHDHGELSVTVLIDETRFHVSGPVDVASRVTVHNSTDTEVTITATGGSFDVVVPGHSLITFAAPAAAGSYPFTSRHSSSFADVLEVR